MISAFENDRTDNSGEGSSNDEVSKSSFLESIEGLAIRQKSNFTENLSVKNTDLANISIDDYAEVESTDKTDKKIDELKSIISSIESRPSCPAEIRLDKTYRINYRNELNIRSA